MDTTYITGLQTLIRACNREMDRAQEMNQPPDIKFLKLLEDTELKWKDATIRFFEKNGPLK